MSRTDKDAPFWVRAVFYEPLHDWYCPYRIARSWQHSRRGSICTLPSTPVRSAPWRRKSGTRVPKVPECLWVPADEWDRRYFTQPPRRIHRRLYFHVPNRQRMRNFVTRTRQLYNGSGDIEDTIEPGRRPSKLDWWD